MSSRESIEEKFRLASREQHLRRREVEKDAEDRCPHLGGSNCLSSSTDTSGRTSIVWHTLYEPDKYGRVRNRIVGICTNCQKEFSASDPEYQLPSLNKPSFSGRKVPLTDADKIYLFDHPKEMRSYTHYEAYALFDEVWNDDDNADPNRWTTTKINEEYEKQVASYKAARLANAT